MFEGRGGVKERAREGKRSEGRNPKSEGNPKSEIRSQRGEGRRRGGRGALGTEFKPPDGRVAQPGVLVGRALRARREHRRMAEMRGFERPPAARSGVRALPLSAHANWATRPDAGPCAAL